jgi:hypothetical protein
MVETSTGDLVAETNRLYPIDSTQIVLDHSRTQFVLDDTVLKAPKWIHVPGVDPLVPEKGIPTVVFLSLHQMRVAGVKYGSLRKAHLWTMLNHESALQLRSNKDIAAWMNSHPNQVPPAGLIAKHFLSTTVGRYLQTIFTQSGHSIAGIRVSGVRLEPVLRPSGEVEDAQRLWPLLEPLMVAGNVPYAFDVEFDLRPWTEDKPSVFRRVLNFFDRND